MSQQNTALIDDIMAALDAESSQNVELIVRNTQNGATKKMALASLEQIIYSYLTTAPVVTNLASVLGGLKGCEFTGDGNDRWYKVIDVTNGKSFAFFVAHDFYRNVSPAIYLITGYMYDDYSECFFYYITGGASKDSVTNYVKVKVDSSTRRITIWMKFVGSVTISHVIPMAGSIPLSQVEETPPEDAVNPTFYN